MKIVKEWTDFSVSSGHESQSYTQEMFEDIVGDQFVAMKVSEEGTPQLIWTEKYVCPILFEVIEVEDIPVLIYRRNPE